ncbi:PREDICTED: MYB-like transcription factor TCL1 isoform X1 [Camelina sativa]|uniref:MYB-like transcription factor TCL1 isoform X1 n=1 Tax=Camelina sativa TaxID=90675 RepID=A0ABM0SPL0_CAMSA|nr:PREDICTED: MYB-like transcription factor TCL1 isoform X1 [Camelina sativa]
MDNTNRFRRVRSFRQTKFTRHDSEEVSSIQWEFIRMTEQEEDLISRMYRLVGDRSHELKRDRCKYILRLKYLNPLRDGLADGFDRGGFNSRKSGRTKGK